MSSWGVSTSSGCMPCIKNTVCIIDVGFISAPIDQDEKGPIIRINPEEVHFNDADFIDTLYPTRNRKTDKPVKVGQRTGSRLLTPANSSQG